MAIAAQRAAIGAWLAAQHGVEACLVVSALGCPAQAGVVLLPPAGRLRALPQAAWGAPA